jgi:hypothetical protein
MAMQGNHGIIDNERNPFATKSWIEQGLSLTPGREEKLEFLFGKSINEIKKIKPNDGKYPSYLGIRWGFAEIQNNTLIPTEKWNQRNEYDGYGYPLSSRTTNYSDMQIKTRSPKIESTFPSSNQVTTKNDGATINIEKLRQELERRKKLLIDYAHDQSVSIDPTERRHIIEFIEHENLPKKPTNEIQLLKEFVSSALSINQPPHRIRGRLQSILGEIPLGDTIPICLNLLFDEPKFLDNRNWNPKNLEKLSNDLLDKNNDSFKNHILITINSISIIMQKELSYGLDNFFEKIANEIKLGPENAWKFMEKFTKEIKNVGPGLMSDFLKNVGFPEFVKIDQRLKVEFPEFINEFNLKNAKSMFISAWKLCAKLNITPFVFDHILYQWNKFK